MTSQTEASCHWGT